MELNAVALVASHGNFRAAARELGISPSALSYSIRTLENRLGVRLFNRTTRSVSLSEAGEQFLVRIKPALREIDEAMSAATNFRDRPSGTLRINASEGAAQQIIEPIIFNFLRLYPEMSVDLVTEGKLVEIVAGGFDAGFRLAEAVPRDMISIACGPDQRLIAVCSPAYLARRKMPQAPADLLEHDCIRHRLASGSILRWEFERRGESFAQDVSGKLTLNSHMLMIKAALAGLGIAYLAEWFVSAELETGQLISLLDGWSPSFPGLCLYYPSHRNMTAGLRAFIEVTREYWWQGHPHASNAAA